MKILDIELPKLEKNIAKEEQIMSLISGSLMLYNALSGKNKSIVKAVAGSYMIFRGATGFCPLSEALHLAEEKIEDAVEVVA